MPTTSLCSVIRRYTQHVHISGTQANNRLRDVLRHQLQQQFHLPVTFYTYNTLLSYHNWSVITVIHGLKSLKIEQAGRRLDLSA